MANGNIFVTVAATGHGCKVRHAHTNVTAGDCVHITNLTGAPIQVYFPNYLTPLWAGAGFGANPLLLANGVTANAFVDASATVGLLEYSVYCEMQNPHPHHADGNSHPGFIVR